MAEGGEGETETGQVGRTETRPRSLLFTAGFKIRIQTRTALIIITLMGLDTPGKQMESDQGHESYRGGHET